MTRRKHKRRTEKLSSAFATDLDAADISRERQRARALRHTQWWKRQAAKGVCHWCGRRTGAGQLTMDHIVPVARGGRSVKGNVVPSCKDCNTAKKQLLPMEWESYLKTAREQAADDEPSD